MSCKIYYVSFLLLLFELLVKLIGLVSPAFSSDVSETFIFIYDKNLSTTIKIITYLRISPKLLVYYFCIYFKMELDNDAKMFISLNSSQLKESGITKTMFIDMTGVEIMSKKKTILQSLWNQLPRNNFSCICEVFLHWTMNICEQFFQ